MKKYIHKLLLGTICALAAHTSWASIISYNGYTHDTNTDVVTGGGLEWLQWDLTIATDVLDALAAYESSYLGGGWRLANNTEMAALFNAFDFGIGSTEHGSWGTDDDVWYISETPSDGDLELETDPEIVFSTMFGTTWKLDEGLGNPFVQTGAVYGDLLDTYGFLNVAYVADDWTHGNGDEAANRAELAGNQANLNGIQWDAGVALVRGLDEPESDTVIVSEPSAAFLFLFGLVGTAFSRLSKTQNTLKS